MYYINYLINIYLIHIIKKIIYLKYTSIMLYFLFMII